jgi:hypothetical protein
MGKMALTASRWERKAIRAAMTVAPILMAARINRIVGKEVMAIVTP